MKERPILICATLAAVLIGSALISVSRAGQQQAAGEDQLQTRQLLERLEKLEARVHELEQWLPRAVIPAAVVPKPRILKGPNTEAIPKGWLLREFNGQWYYDIPLDRSPAPR